MCFSVRQKPFLCHKCLNWVAYTHSPSFDVNEMFKKFILKFINATVANDLRHNCAFYYQKPIYKFINCILQISQCYLWLRIVWASRWGGWLLICITLLPLSTGSTCCIDLTAVLVGEKSKFFKRKSILSWWENALALRLVYIFHLF